MTNQTILIALETARNLIDTRRQFLELQIADANREICDLDTLRYQHWGRRAMAQAELWELNRQAAELKDIGGKPIAT